jgi:hypothetical protein
LFTTAVATIETAKDITHCRDGKTGSHLDRITHYARLIAVSIADNYSLNDESRSCSGFRRCTISARSTHPTGYSGIDEAWQPRR